MNGGDFTQDAIFAIDGRGDLFVFNRRFQESHDGLHARLFEQAIGIFRGGARSDDDGSVVHGAVEKEAGEEVDA